MIEIEKEAEEVYPVYMLMYDGVHQYDSNFDKRIGYIAGRTKSEEGEKLLEESNLLMHECIQVFNGSYQLDDRYTKLLALTEKIELYLYPKPNSHE